MRCRPTGSSEHSPRSCENCSADYDAVVIVVFDEDFRVVQGFRLSRRTVEELFAHRVHVNGRVITLTKKLREHPDVEHLDLSDALLDE